MSNELKPLHFDADYTMEEALAEAKRCLNCPKPLCRMGCPIENEIPRFIQAIAHGNFGLANDILAERTNLPSICGRVCPRENQCEGNCIHPLAPLKRLSPVYSPQREIRSVVFPFHRVL